MKNPYYVCRHRRDGRAAHGYAFGANTRYPTEDAAMTAGQELAQQLSSVCPYDIVVVGVGQVRNGLSVGQGRRLAEIRCQPAA